MQQVYSSKGFMLVRSLNPDTEDEDESNHEEAHEGEVPVRTDSESKEKLFVSKFQNSGE